MYVETLVVSAPKMVFLASNFASDMLVWTAVPGCTHYRAQLGSWNAVDQLQDASGITIADNMVSWKLSDTVLSGKPNSVAVQGHNGINYGPFSEAVQVVSKQPAINGLSWDGSTFTV